MKVLYLIPARGGSKGIPHKNIKLLNGKPLICYSIDVALKLASDEDVCVSTDDPAIIKVVEDYGLKVPFMRPAEFATDHCGSTEVIRHAYGFFEDKGLKYDVIMLLQPTSPFRSPDDVSHCLEKYHQCLDMVVSVKEVSSNPYYNCFEPDLNGLLHHSKGDGGYVRRQDAPPAYEYNGAAYAINPESIKAMPIGSFTKVGFVVMDELHSLDIDNMIDWKLAELLLQEKMITL
jgi:CMP-N,N'-diacetyllegionaminic acid synthase